MSYATKVQMDEGEVLEEVERIARRAVSDRLVADRTVGVFLSGGVDSSLITALTAQSGATSVEAVAVGFDDPTFDERPFARRVAAARPPASLAWPSPLVRCGDRGRQLSVRARR